MNATNFAKILGWIFIIIGIVGFFVGDMLLVFEVNATHNIVHLASGVLALAAVGMNMASLYLKIFGLVYAVVAVIGFAMGGDILGYFHVNMADNLLHVAIAALSLFFGFNVKKS